jgi:hypothetical protein
MRTRPCVLATVLGAALVLSACGAVPSPTTPPGSNVTARAAAQDARPSSDRAESPGRSSPSSAAPRRDVIRRR